jgi:hypothetical protein
MGSEAVKSVQIEHALAGASHPGSPLLPLAPEGILESRWIDSLADSRPLG